MSASYIANHLGANFESGFAMHGGGVTTQVQQQIVDINGQNILMVDAPGLIEPDLVATRRNAEEITEALKLGKKNRKPLKIGIIVMDHNGRIQRSDMLLIQKVNQALTPRFEILLIVNQVKRRNMQHYATRECIETLVNRIHEYTQAIVRTDRVIVIEDQDEGDLPDLEPLKNMLDKIVKQEVRDVQDIKITEEEFQTIGEQILIYTVATLAVLTSPVWGPPYLIYKAIKK
ncbi:hypothetical protein BX616_000905 [Lobosporangium transversale]|nr:hypothetical protein BX616_000905 [Lobosporangium transversale]